jgi:propionate CoA-transferase
VEQISFSGRIARDRGQDVTYVTERAVFKLTVRGLTLTELAPGIDLHRDVLDLIPFEPLIAAELLPMDPRIFHVHPMGIELQRRESGAPS